MEIEKKTGVNFDYILVLDYSRSNSEVIKVPIIRQESLINKLLKMIENIKYDAGDMNDLLSMSIDVKSSYPYCLAHEYSASYIDDISFPDFDSDLYRITFRNFQTQLIKKLERILRHHPEKREYLELKFKKQILNKKLKDKESYAKQALSFIYANDYHNTLKKYDIEQKYAIFSNEVHGRHRQYNPSCFVGEDITVSIFTNFCYGKSAFFHCSIKYKNIPLLPYSVWINYYYAGYNEILKCTRSFRIVRNSWNHCLLFIRNFINSANNNPRQFFMNEVTREIQDLIIGLEKIMSYNEEKYELEMQVDRGQNAENYIGILAARHRNEKEREYFRIAPRECSMIYRMEKICGALNFLGSLKVVKEIYPKVDTAINKIKCFNQQIYPEVISAIHPLKIQIKNIKKNIKTISRALDYKEKRLRYYENRMDKYIEKGLSGGTQVSKDIFYDLRQKRDRIKSEIIHLEESYNKYDCELLDRTSLLNRLDDYKLLIELNIDGIK